MLASVQTLAPAWLRELEAEDKKGGGLWCL